MGVLSFLYWLLNLSKENCSCKQMLFLDPGIEPFFKSRVLQGSLIKQTVSINSALKDPSCCLILLFFLFIKYHLQVARMSLTSSRVSAGFLRQSILLIYCERKRPPRIAVQSFQDLNCPLKYLHSTN